MADEATLIPPPDEQEALLEEFEALLSNQGWEPLVASLVVLPTEKFFPDRWQGGVPSLARLARRLMHYADLDEFRVEVAVFDDEGGKPGTSNRGPGGGVWFDGLVRKGDGAVCRFSADGLAMREPKPLVAAMARAVTQAWLERRGQLIPETTKDAEQRARRERVIDLATVVLGFGVLTTDATIMHHAKSAGGFRATRSKTRLGVLPPQHMAFALAMMAVVRETPRPARRSWQQHLQANQAAFFRKSHALLEPRRSSLVGQLGIPPKTAWPEPDELDVGEVFEGDSDDPEDGEGSEAAVEERKDEDKGVKGQNIGKPVFRVERTMAMRIGRVVLMGTFMVGGLMSRGFKGVDISMPHIIVGGLILGALGLVVGRFFPDVRCSEPKCGIRLSAEDETCPLCGGTIMGAIKHPKERLAAEEALTRSESGEIVDGENSKRS